MLRKDVLRKNKDFNEIYKRGKSTGQKYVVVFSKKNDLSYNRVAFLASKKVGNSVKRNKSKRLMRESYRVFEKKLETSYDIIIIARNTINNTEYLKVQKSLENAFKKLKLLV